MSAVPSIVGQTLGHYRVLEKVGAGGMGIVFRAHDERLDRDIAIKVLPAGTLANEAARKQFRAEALTLSKLSHANIAHIYDFDTQHGIDFLVMEFVRGVSLEQKLAGRALSEEEVIHLGRQVAGTLQDVAQLGIVHRDIKPGNIMITPQGEPKLLDFGLAKLLRASGTDATRSFDDLREMAGTLPYMSPEQVKNLPTDFRTDVYSLGAVLYESATGERPFPAKDVSTLIADIARKSPTPPRQLNPDLSAGLERLIQRCLAKDPARRYQTAAEIRAALEALESVQIPVAIVPAAKQPTTPLLIFGLAILLLVTAGAAFIAARKWNRPPNTAASQVNELAILPPNTSHQDGEIIAFGEGMVHTLTSRLTQLTGAHPFQVVPASEMRSKRVSTLQEAREEFGANLGLELSLERAGEMLRVNYALIDAKRHQQLRGDTITASMSDPFAIEDQVADSVVQALQIELRPEEQQSQTNHGTTQPQAYDYYVQGQGYLQDFQKQENVDNAIAEFNRALQYDPNYALASSGLGEALWRKYEHTKQPEFVGQAKSACNRAVQLRPEESAGHLCLGLLDAGTGAYDKAVEEYQLAAKLEPTSDAAYSGLAGAYERLGKSQEAESTFRKAISLRPSYWAGYNRLGIFYLRHGRYAEASEMFSQVIALVPDSFAGYANLGGSYIYRGDYAQAIPALERSVEIRPTEEASSNLGTAYFQLHQYSHSARALEKAAALGPSNYEIWGNLADAYYWAPGERAKAKDAYRMALDLAFKQLAVNPQDANLLSFIADYYAMSGDCAPALTQLRRAMAIAPPGPDLLGTAALVFNQCGKQEDALTSLEKAVAAGYSTATLRDTPNFDNLRNLPRFQKLLASQ